MYATAKESMPKKNLPSSSVEQKEGAPKRAFLISVYKESRKQALCQEHLDELELLSETLGLEVIEKKPCLLRKFESSTLLTQGKLEEFIQLAQQVNAELIVFDDEITPSQQRNLESAFSIPVMDRTELILEVFAARAQTKEARLQIELARLQYQAPRLKRLWTHLSRQAGSAGGGGGGGSGGYLKGEGEKQIEIDRRILKKQLLQLRSQITDVRSMREVQRSARERATLPIFSIIGYTNVGKSTLLNALTKANVLVENKLFATLDTTTRKYILKNNQEILLIDTVGFIRKLPHLLVAAFKSTLEEALYADILLHIIDVSHPFAEEQAKTTFEVLQALQTEEKPIITVLNKVDQSTTPSVIQRLQLQYPKSVQISALKGTGLTDLEERMVEELGKQRTVVSMRIPQSEYAVATEVIRLGNVLSKCYEENDIILRVDLPKAVANRLKQYWTQ